MAVARRLALAIIAIAVFVPGAAGQPPDAAPPGDEASEDDRLFRFRGSLEWLSALRWLEPADTPLNPGNTVLRVPQFWAQTEVRPDARLEIGSRLTAVARPRLLAVTETSWSDPASSRREVHDTSANWTELYVNWRPADALQVTYGLQNFQWGPAELLAPSNRVFHEIGIYRDPLYYVRGRHLARVNLSAGREWSVVVFGELTDNGEPAFNAGEPFRRQVAAKFEYSAPTGAGYVGVTGGARAGARPWVGEYVSFSLTEGLSAYVDASHSMENTAWYPELTIGGAVFSRRHADADGWFTLAVAGLRYTFVNGVDLRGEFLHQDAGYRERDFKVAAVAAAQAGSVETLAPYVAPGLELLGRQMTLLSLRVPDLPPSDHLAVLGRYLHSLADGSGVVVTTMTLETSDALVLFATGTVTHGRDYAEFSRLARGSIVAGADVRW